MEAPISPFDLATADAAVLQEDGPLRLPSVLDGSGSKLLYDEGASPLLAVAHDQVSMMVTRAVAVPLHAFEANCVDLNVEGNLANPEIRVLLQTACLVHVALIALKASATARADQMQGAHSRLRIGRAQPEQNRVFGVGRHPLGL